ncbi:MAG: hypothetical protein MK052_03240, partial [Alphaproteobacteria bacterium]|nr:hypothetical protein [Alphaproteobacteria bacterium]
MSNSTPHPPNKTRIYWNEKLDGIAKTVDEIVADMTDNPHVTQVDISYANDLGTDNINRLLDAAEGCSNLEIINISSTKLDASNLSHLTQALTKTSKINDVNLVNCGLESETADTLLSALVDKDIRKLNISTNRLVGGGGEMLCNFLRQHENIESFVATDTRLAAEDFNNATLHASAVRCLPLARICKQRIEEDKICLI